MDGLVKLMVDSVSAKDFSPDYCSVCEVDVDIGILKIRGKFGMLDLYIIAVSILLVAGSVSSPIELSIGS